MKVSFRSYFPMIMLLVSIVVMPVVRSATIRIRRMGGGTSSSTITGKFSELNNSNRAMFRQRRQSIAGTGIGWGDWIMSGLLGGSNPLAHSMLGVHNLGSFGVGWDELFGQALLQITGYGQQQHGGGGGGGGAVDHHYHQHHHGGGEQLLGTHTVVTQKVAYPVPQPYAVPIERPVPYPVHIPVPIDRPYPVTVLKAVPIPVERHVPVPVDRPYPVPVHHHIPVPVYKHINVHVPAPYPVPVPKPYAVPLPVHHQHHSSSHHYDEQQHTPSYFVDGHHQHVHQPQDQHGATFQHYAQHRISNTLVP